MKRLDSRNCPTENRQKTFRGHKFNNPITVADTQVASAGWVPNKYFMGFSTSPIE